jgi:hypothetical protein
MISKLLVLIPTTIALAIANAGATNALGYCKPITRSQLNWVTTKIGTPMGFLIPALNPTCQLSTFVYLPFDWDPANGIVLIDDGVRYIGYDFYLRPLPGGNDR